MAAIKSIQTESAPQAIGCYSQAVEAGSWVFLSGQIGVDPHTQQLVEGIQAQLQQTFKNLEQVVFAAGGNFSQIVKLTIYLTSLSHFALVNEIMVQYFKAPFPARAAIEVVALPKGALVEIDGVMII